MGQIIKSKAPARVVISDEIQNWKKVSKNSCSHWIYAIWLQKNIGVRPSCVSSIEPEHQCLIQKNQDLRSLFFHSVQRWPSLAIQWNTTQSHLQLSKQNKEDDKSQKAFLFLFIPASDLMCSCYAKSASLKFSDATCAHFGSVYWLHWKQYKLQVLIISRKKP